MYLDMYPIVMTISRYVSYRGKSVSLHPCCQHDLKEQTTMKIEFNFKNFFMKMHLKMLFMKWQFFVYTSMC